MGAHGTGAAVPPVDEQVVRYKLHTPALGALELSAESHPRLFWLAKARARVRVRVRVRASASPRKTRPP